MTLPKIVPVDLVNMVIWVLKYDSRAKYSEEIVVTYFDCYFRKFVKEEDLGS